MLITIFGSPSPLSYWTIAALRSTVDSCLAPHRYVETPTLEPLRQAVAEREGAPLIYFCDCPEAELAHAFVESGAPYVVCLEPPLEVMGFLVRHRGMRALDALRFTAQCYSALHDLTLGLKAQVMRRAPDLSASQAVIDLCSTFRITSDAARAAESVRLLTGGLALTDSPVEDLILGSSPNARPIGGYAANLSEFGVPPWMADIANQYAPLVEGRAIDAFFWPREAFLDPLGPEEIVAPEQGLCGPSRLMVFGPFLHLPVGAWRATVGIEVADVRATAMTADVAIKAEPAQIVRFKLPERGKFEFTLDFEVKEPRHFIEIRLILPNGAIEGKFAFNGVELRRRENSNLVTASGGERESVDADAPSAGPR